LIKIKSDRPAKTGSKRILEATLQAPRGPGRSAGARRSIDARTNHPEPYLRALSDGIQVIQVDLHQTKMTAPDTIFQHCDASKPRPQK
jgi:hypothetical protein